LKLPLDFAQILLKDRSSLYPWEGIDIIEQPQQFVGVFLSKQIGP
jgi:hypothetical protein